ncbi:hypothetical protein [Spirillospora albida]|uniref:hypothetical protein n=1 Tax=Spirillospora albida TaxID=58123 RepID=UPI0004BF64E5|nr:hypothetical protein [Spirillospora albida]
MTPGSLVLLHTAGAAAWGDLPGELRAAGLTVIVPDAEGSGPRYVARASLLIAAAAPPQPLVLVARGAAGPLVPAVALAQRAAHRAVGAYVFVDADLPRPRRAHDHDHAEEHSEAPTGAHAGTQTPIPPDWPEAPCVYLRTAQDHMTEAALREARLRGWTTAEAAPASGAPLAETLARLIAGL